MSWGRQPVHVAAASSCFLHMDHRLLYLPSPPLMSAQVLALRGELENRARALQGLQADMKGLQVGRLGRLGGCASQAGAAPAIRCSACSVLVQPGARCDV